MSTIVYLSDYWSSNDVRLQETRKDNWTPFHFWDPANSWTQYGIPAHKKIRTHLKWCKAGKSDMSPYVTRTVIDQALVICWIGWQSLENRRKRMRLITLYQITKHNTFISKDSLTNRLDTLVIWTNIPLFQNIASRNENL